MNSVYLVGNVGTILTDNLQMEKKAFIVCSLATSEKYIDKANNEVVNTQWHKIVFSGKIAEIAREALKVGVRMFVQGKLTYNEFERDGKKVQSAQVNVVSFVIK